MRTVVPDFPMIREATNEDLEPIERLLRAQGPSGVPRRPEQLALPRVPGQRHLLVIDAPDGGLAGAALLCIEGHRGHLVMLAVARRFEGRGLEDRLIAVSEALCSAFGADTLDVPVRSAA
jgi:N-acetylglutamate synthase-like GNAT family acetyltransferase